MTAIRQGRIITFVETALFTRLVASYIEDDSYRALQVVLACDPAAGSVIPRSGGIRKIRWGAMGRGKRGGVRVVYFLKQASGVIWLLTIYAKNEVADIPPEALRRIREEIENE